MFRCNEEKTQRYNDSLYRKKRRENKIVKGWHWSDDPALTVKPGRFWINIWSPSAYISWRRYLYEVEVDVPMKYAHGGWCNSGDICLNIKKLSQVNVKLIFDCGKEPKVNYDNWDDIHGDPEYNKAYDAYFGRVVDFLDTYMIQIGLYKDEED